MCAIAAEMGAPSAHLRQTTQLLACGATSAQAEPDAMVSLPDGGALALSWLIGNLTVQVLAKIARGSRAASDHRGHGPVQQLVLSWAAIAAQTPDENTTQLQAARDASWLTNRPEVARRGCFATGPSVQ